MSILDVTEDQIFHTLGKGKDPNFKPIEKVRPVAPRPKKTYTADTAIKPAHSQKEQMLVEPVKSAPSYNIDDSMMKITEKMNELNLQVSGIQRMVKWYIVPQFAIVLVLLLVLLAK